MTDRLAEVRELLGRATFPVSIEECTRDLAHDIELTTYVVRIGSTAWAEFNSRKGAEDYVALRNIAPDLLAAVEAAEEVIQAHDQQTGPVSIYLRAKVVRLREALGRLRAGT
jgi:hypothetical protein